MKPSEAMIRLVQAEFLKLKRSPAWWLAFGFPLLFGLYFLAQGYFDPAMYLQDGKDRVWARIIAFVVSTWLFLFLPIFSCLYVFLACNIEGGGGLAAQYTFPQTRGLLYVAKFIAIELLLLLCMLVYVLGLSVSALLLHVVQPHLPLLQYLPPASIVFATIVIPWFFSLFGMAILQLVFIRINSLPVAMGLVLAIVTSMFIFGSVDSLRYVQIHPWLMSAYVYNDVVSSYYPPLKQKPFELSYIAPWLLNTIGVILLNIWGAMREENRQFK